MRCERCHNETYSSNSLADTFHFLRRECEEQRVHVLAARDENRRLRYLTHIATISRERLRCAECHRGGLLPIKVNTVCGNGGTRTEYHYRKMDDTNIIFFLLAGFLWFFTTKELEVLWRKLGLRPSEIHPPILPRGMKKKEANLIALHKRLTRVLEPNNADLVIGSWPWVHPE